MSNSIYLLETKKEYTIHLINTLTPLLYQGIQSIYDDVKNNISDNDELKVFQSLLRKIPSWSDYIITNEVSRILKNAEKGEILEDLIRAVIKANIMILTDTPIEKKNKLRIKHDITTQKFIHSSYIEIARNIFQNPYLFYHKYSSYELKKNQREAYTIIKNSIEQAIRKLLPMNIILQSYIGNTFSNTDDFNNNIPDDDFTKIKDLLNNEKEDTVYKLVKSDTINIDIKGSNNAVSVKNKNNSSSYIGDSKNNNNNNNIINDDDDDNNGSTDDISVSYYKHMYTDNIEAVYDNNRNKKDNLVSDISCSNTGDFNYIIGDVLSINNKIK